MGVRPRNATCCWGCSWAGMPTGSLTPISGGALNAAVQAAPAAWPGTIAAAAGVLLEELDDGWLRDQVAGLRTYAHVLAGQARTPTR